jgi:hypothetical protein
MVNTWKERTMRVITTSVEEVGPGRILLSTVIDLETGGGSTPPPNPPAIEVSLGRSELGEGPTGNAVPDRIVRALIDSPSFDLPISEVQSIVGGNPGTVNRQAWTLATNAKDLQIRLRGWVFSPERGKYSLTPAAIRRIKNKGS